MKFKNYFFAIACLGFLVTSCSPQSIDEDTTLQNIKGATQTQDIDRRDIKIPTHG